MSRFHSIVRKLWPRSNVKKAVILLVIIIVVGSGGFITVSEQTWFCNSCHIMNPYYASWQASGHSEVNCLECHVQPGFAGIVRAKLNGLAQLVDCVLGRTSPKPNALVKDASCLRIGCHATKSLGAEPLKVSQKKYKFSHRNHVDVNVDGLPLRCTTCHSHFEGEDHFKVSTQVCFVCHFSKDGTSSIVRSIDTRCRDCHEVPARSFKRGVAEIDHSKFIAAKLDCEQLCHNKQVDPNAHVPDVSCLDCHAFRNQGQDNSRDLHVLHSGKDKVECLACHEMINHSASPIRKHHTSLQCSQCHQVPFEGARLADIGFIKLPGDCSLCHSDPHSGQFKKTCQQCHSEHGWIRPWLTNIHGSNASFPLKGKHKNVECAKCHIGPRLAQARFTGLPRTCEQCHPDPHDRQFTQGCTTCHSEQGWKNRLIDPHGPGSSHPLHGKHAVLECVKCHIPPRPGAPLAEARFVGLADKGCASCHEDPHGGQMHSACNTCHTEQGWTGRFLLFTHNKNSEFKLNPLHADLACTSCHTRADKHLFRPLPKTCELCHADIVRRQFAEDYPAVGRPDPHANRVSCVQCHSPDKPHPTPADYAGACRGCHNSYYEGLFYDWMKSLNSRKSRAKSLLERLRERNASKAEVLEQRIKQAKSTGFHNLALALKLWDEILIDGFHGGVHDEITSTKTTDK